VIATILILLGTLAPLIFEIFDGGKISIGAPWFEVAFLVPMIPLILLLGLGMHTAWRKQNSRPWIKLLKQPAMTAVIIGILLPLMFYGRSSLLLVIGCGSAAWIVISSLIQPIRSLIRAEGVASITRSALGMSIAHLGVGLFVIGVTITSAFGVETDRAMRIGETSEVAGLQFEFRGLRDIQGPNYVATEGILEIRDKGEFIGTVRPQKRQYLVQKDLMTEASIYPTWNKDLFVALGEQIGEDTWSIRIQYKPMIRFIWIGAFIMAIGGLISITDRRYRKVA
jgi:cytochrome c-type biogenesis protein CcmF